LWAQDLPPRILGGAPQLTLHHLDGVQVGGEAGVDVEDLLGVPDHPQEVAGEDNLGTTEGGRRGVSTPKIGVGAPKTGGLRPKIGGGHPKNGGAPGGGQPGERRGLGLVSPSLGWHPEIQGVGTPKLGCRGGSTPKTRGLHPKNGRRRPPEMGAAGGGRAPEMGGFGLVSPQNGGDGGGSTPKKGGSTPKLAPRRKWGFRAPGCTPKRGEKGGQHPKNGTQKARGVQDSLLNPKKGGIPQKGGQDGGEHPKKRGSTPKRAPV